LCVAAGMVIGTPPEFPKNQPAKNLAGHASLPV
jgi:hypothetical protein